MITITLENLGKRFGNDWVFRKLSREFKSGHSYAILGPNGSGKSTLMQLIASNLSPTEGAVRFSYGTTPVDPEDIFCHISLCAPYVQLIEEFTLREQLEFHFSFKKMINGVGSLQEVISLLGFEDHTDKQIRHFSSGMKQRVKLTTCLLSDTSVILLDEPATNLDANGIAWYREILKQYSRERLLIISSNRPEEYEMCEERISVKDYRR